VTDVLVAGGGPAGLATAIHAALVGFDVAIVEPRPAPLDKACGEGLMPSAVRQLRDIGVAPIGCAFHGIRYVADDRSVASRFRAGPGLGVRRTALHAALSNRADALGVERVTGRVGDIRQDRGQVTVAVTSNGRGTATTRQTRWLVAADGLHSSIRRTLGLEVPSRGRPRRGLRRHYAIAPWTDLVEVHWSPFAEAYVTPVAADCVGVAVLFTGRGSYDDWLGQFPALRTRLGDASPASPVLGAGPMHQRVRQRVAGRVLLVGDAAGYVDALTGEGINLGLAAAAELVRCLQAERPDAYDASWRRLSRRYRAMTTALLWASWQRPVRRAIVPAAQRFPRLYGAAVNALA
jgi:2-polyprenyl-6-methoxyphenol hydroxylase-like FAD-dependent oxidoreductase